jgi:hypothetical protein
MPDLVANGLAVLDDIIEHRLVEAEGLHTSGSYTILVIHVFLLGLYRSSEAARNGVASYYQMRY